MNPGRLGLGSGSGSAEAIRPIGAFLVAGNHTLNILPIPLILGGPTMKRNGTCGLSSRLAVSRNSGSGDTDGEPDMTILLIGVLGFVAGVLATCAALALCGIAYKGQSSAIPPT